MKKILVLTLTFLFSLMVTAQDKENLTIQGSKGRLAAVIQKPQLQDGERCDMVMILHGFTASKEMPLLQYIADSLQTKGIASIRFDFNGHGKSEGDFQKMTVLNEIEDAKAVYNYVSSLPWVRSVSIVGHSQGGVVASMTAGELGTDHVTSLVLLAPAAVLREDAIRGNTQGATYNPLDPPEYVELRGGLRLGRDYIKTAFSLPIYETAAHYQGPACMIHGTGDTIVPYTYSLRYDEKYQHSELHLLEGYDHGFSQNTIHAATLAVDFIVRQLKYASISHL